MRLIDADVLWKDITSAYDDCEDILEIIDRQHTIEPRQKGEWIDGGRDKVVRWCCSVCGRWDRYVYNFCPDCGADMREENR